MIAMTAIQLILNKPRIMAAQKAIVKKWLIQNQVVRASLSTFKSSPFTGGIISSVVLFNSFVIEVNSIPLALKYPMIFGSAATVAERLPPASCNKMIPFDGLDSYCLIVRL